MPPTGLSGSDCTVTCVSVTSAFGSSLDDDVDPWCRALGLLPLSTECHAVCSFRAATSSFRFAIGSFAPLALLLPAKLNPSIKPSLGSFPWFLSSLFSTSLLSLSRCFCSILSSTVSRSSRLARSSPRQTKRMTCLQAEMKCTRPFSPTCTSSAATYFMGRDCSALKELGPPAGTGSLPCPSTSRNALLMKFKAWPRGNDMR
mmetsp:Transcript_59466/g.130486  ORF Transcript_59466/g.130486 Transcript_59466/m.130486 type:complete len:202 (-) Transcript_59466:595-1200(-)